MLVAYFDLQIRFIPQEKVDNNVGSDFSTGPKAQISQLFQTTNPLIAGIRHRTKNYLRTISLLPKKTVSERCSC